ncbi:AAA family ATPase [Priestia flexa]|uniref:AAA family ATPase n=1 Tax=Priestia flexa TaxID=86664 RepID=UPI00203D8EFB|nr:AAA family ATPase [Priestia flexa]MCM3068278.1 AAA family ATPase [Priestia flexa]
MKTAVDFLAEWASGEEWKIHVLNKVKMENGTDSSELLGEVLHFIKTKETVELIGEIESGSLEGKKLIINEIKSPRNINAISGDAQFSLGKNLNVFYGENGSGKSSYVRMFRKLAVHYYTSEKDLTILPNVYEEEQLEDRLKQTVEVAYLLDEKANNDLVDINKPHTVLSKINVFDSDSILPLINSDLTFSILPKGFDKFQMVTVLLDSLRKQVAATIQVEEEKQKKIFSDSSYDFIREELNKITEEVKDSNKIKEFLDSNYPSSEAFEEVIGEIDLQIKDLESANPKDKITILTAQKTKLSAIRDSFKKLSAILNMENIEKVNSLINDYELKIQEERDFNDAFKKNVSFLNVVNDEWFSFVKMGKKYYESINQDHIHEGNSCIFCSQSLSATSVSVIETNFSHIAKSNKGSIDAIEKELLKQDLQTTMVNFSNEEIALIESERLLGRIKSTIQLVNRNKELFSSLLTSKKTITDDVILDLTDIFEEINRELNEIEGRIKNLNDSKEETDKKIGSLKDIREIFKKNEKIHSSLDLLLEWFNIQKSIKELSTAKSKFSTTSLTQKQSEAFQSIVQDEYFEIFEQFAQELKVSNINLRLIPKKGETLRKKSVSSKEYKVSQIMSEGEQKAVAMAEFATDLTMRRDFNTILFDDPVTSLDYKRSEIISNLIYRLSLERQVIVFTHNIMFYYYLYNACAKDKNKENKFFKVDEFDKLNKGIVSESFSGRLETLKEVVGKLKNQAQFINSKSCVGDVLEEALKKVYSDIRTWCELIVEEGFFNSVIRRHEANIMFTKLKEIKGSFVDELDSVSELFDRSCRWMAGHSQSIETQHVRANREAFNNDMKYINQLFDQYKK